MDYEKSRDIPMVVNGVITGLDNHDGYIIGYECPVCRVSLKKEDDFNFCPCCGQAITFEDEEDE